MLRQRQPDLEDKHDRTCQHFGDYSESETIREDSFDTTRVYDMLDENSSLLKVQGGGYS